MFEEDIELNGVAQARFAKIPLEIRVSEELSPKDFEDLGEMVIGRAYVKHDDCVFVRGFIDQKCVGFWVGYFEPQGAFVSWLGAVRKEFRNLGIAHDLFMKTLEQAHAKGCKIVRAQVLNSSGELLMFYLKNHFKIMGFESGDRVLLEKV